MPKNAKPSARDLSLASPQVQCTYMGDYIKATTSISGLEQNQTSTTFNSAAGPFIPASNIILTSQNLIQENIELQSGEQKLLIEQIILTPPNREQEGFVSLKSKFTDIYGKGEKSYVGIIANWVQGEIPICSNSKD